MIEKLERGEGARLRAIRLLALTDAPDAFGTTVNEALRWDPENWEAQIEKFPTFVWREGWIDFGMIRGAAHEGDPMAGYLISMWVATEGRRRGIGTALVDEVIEWARKLGFLRLVLDVGADNVAARALYESQGFTLTGAEGALPPPREHVKELEMEIVFK
jgi:ribosomal protein S18 acetylase RimI-like enzyme